MSESSTPTPPLWPGSLAELRHELERRGLRLTKRFGQNFMIDPNLARAVVRAAGVGEGDVLLEVGPGAGHLTGAILEAGARVVAVEIDAGLCMMLRDHLGGEARFRLVEGSVLGEGDVLSPAVVEVLNDEMRCAGRESFKTASNLPYNIAVPFLIALAGSDLPWSCGAVTLQREVAERLVASPGTKAYGAPSILWQLSAEGRLDRTIPPEVFWPRPRVESALLTIRPRAERVKGTVPFISGASSTSLGRSVGRGTAFLPPGFAEFVKALFSSRRKVLRSGVAKAAPTLSKQSIESALAAAGTDPGARPEDVAPEELLELWRSLASV